MEPAPLPWLPAGSASIRFPDPAQALSDPDGLLAVGGDLRPETLLKAYRNGIFPWYSDGQPILWWSPDPRLILPPDELHLSRSLRKTLRRGRFEVSLDCDFEAVIKACAQPRAALQADQQGTWITEDMQQAYIRLHRLGHAHSVESWLDGKLVGGLYGVAIGPVFFGESMFARVSDASKVAFAHLCRQLQGWNYTLIDCQVVTDHLVSLGARSIPREDFIQRIKPATTQGIPKPSPRWRLDTFDWA